jgi:hypothetical protein
MTTITSSQPEAAEAAPIEGTVAVRQPGQVRRKNEPIDGALLWYLLTRYLAHYVAFPSRAALNLVAAWIIAACARERDDSGIGQLIWRAFALLLVTSRVRRSGKSTLLDLIAILTRSRRGKVPKITPARFAQVTGQYCETVILDEVRTIVGSGAKNLELQGCLLAAYTRRTSYEVSGKSLDLFGAVALAAKENIITESWNGDTIGDLWDRTLKVMLAAPPQPMPEVGEQAEDDGDMLARALIAWTDAMRADLKQAARDIAAEDSEAVTDGNMRRAQISRPLRAIARVIGPGCEEDVCTALDEITAGKASAEAGEILGGLRERAWAQEDGDEDWSASESGRIVYAPEDDGSEDEPPAAQGYNAGQAITFPGRETALIDLPGPWPTAEEAQQTCEAMAGQPLTWQASDKYYDTWHAVIHPSGPDGPEVVYGVSLSAGE